jgi:hypothetical protein
MLRGLIHGLASVVDCESAFVDFSVTFLGLLVTLGSFSLFVAFVFAIAESGGKTSPSQ